MPEVNNTTEEYLPKLVKFINKKFTDLEDRITRLESKIQTSQTSALSGYHEQQPVQKIPEVAENGLYFAHGVKGVFLRSTGTPEFQDRLSLYRFKKINENEALVSVVNELSVVNKFRRNPDALDGVCEQLNQCNENTKGIETVKPGRAVVEGDKWRITTVAEIRYI